MTTTFKGLDTFPYFQDHHYEVREMVRKFAEEKVAPRARDLDENKTFPHETVAEMKELGLLGIPFSEEWGGAGLTLALRLWAMRCLREAESAVGRSRLDRIERTMWAAW